LSSYRYHLHKSSFTQTVNSLENVMVKKLYKEVLLL